MNPIYIKIDEYGSHYYYSDAAMKTLHRIDGPAIERANRDKLWYVNGKIHRDEGPAYVGADGTKAWYLNGQRHRTDGPAIEWANGSKEWYLNWKRLSEAEFLAATATEVVLTLDMIAAKFGVNVKDIKIKK